VSGRFPWTPLQNWLVTPESQWQSRGQRRILQGCPRVTPELGNGWAGEPKIDKISVTFGDGLKADVSVQGVALKAAPGTHVELRNR
jgi:hypothetical protein